MAEHSSIVRLELSPFDQTGQRLYVHKFFCFNFPDASKKDDAIEHLVQRCAVAIARWPFITGAVVPCPTRVGFLELHYDPSKTAPTARDLLIIKDIGGSPESMSFATLAEIGMPPILMDIGRYSSVPEWPTAGEVYPALAIQVNFVKDGLILCFAFHHAVADGGAFTEFVKEFGSGTTDPGNMSPVAPRIGYIAAPADQILPLTSFPEYDSRRAPTRAASTGEATTTTAIFQFSAETVRQLEGAVAAQLKKTIGPDAWASNIACLSSLVWVAVVRARQARLAASDTAKIGIAVNARSVLRLPDDYFGNCIVHTNATASVEELLSADTSANIEGSPSIISIAAVAHAAWKMRQAVKGVNSKYVNDRLTTFSALEDPGEVSRAYEAATDNANTGIDFSSWRDQGADVEFGIPGTCTSKVDVWRKGWSPNEGAYNILPRKGGSKGEACWEVSLGLSKQDMERVVVWEELGSWTTRWVGESLGSVVKGSQPSMEE